MKIFISGSIEGPLDKIRLRYRKVERKLARQNNTVFSPFFLNNNSVLSLPFRIELLSCCEALFLLSDWLQSKESAVEKCYAEMKGKTILFQSKIQADQEHDKVKKNKIVRISCAIQEVTGKSLQEYIGGSRQQESFYNKMLFSVHCKNAGLEPEEIAEILDRDVTTVQYQIKKFPNEVKWNPKFRDISERVTEILSR